MKSLHIHLLKFVGVALVFILTIIFTDSSQGYDLSKSTGATVANTPASSRLDSSRELRLNGSTKLQVEVTGQPTRELEGWEVPKFDFTPYVPTFVPHGLKIEGIGVVSSLQRDNYYIYYQFNGMPIMEIYQAVGLEYDWDNRPEMIDLPWGKVEIGTKEEDKPYHMNGWIAVVRPDPVGNKRLPNVVVISDMPEKDALLAVVQSLQTVEGSPGSAHPTIN